MLLAMIPTEKRKVRMTLATDSALPGGGYESVLIKN